jgi:hypothetical protein
MTDPGAPPPELRELLATERDVSAAERAAIRHKLATSLATPPPATGVLASKLLWVAAGALVVAGVWWYIGRGPTRDKADAPMITPPASSEHVEQPAIAPQPEAAPPPAPQKRPPNTLPPPTVPQPIAPAPIGVPSQADLLARAWQALARQDAATTLQLLDEDERAHPDGALVEEREAMHVQALAAAGRRDDAQHEADAFLARYPHSVHRTAVSRAVAP